MGARVTSHCASIGAPDPSRPPSSSAPSPGNAAMLVSTLIASASAAVSTNVQAPGQSSKMRASVRIAPAPLRRERSAAGAREAHRREDRRALAAPVVVATQARLRGRHPGLCPLRRRAAHREDRHAPRRPRARAWRARSAARASCRRAGRDDARPAPAAVPLTSSAAPRAPSAAPRARRGRRASARSTFTRCDVVLGCASSPMSARSGFGSAKRAALSRRDVDVDFATAVRQRAWVLRMSYAPKESRRSAHGTASGPRSRRSR